MGDSPFGRDEVHRIAALAHLALSGEEEAQMAHDLAGILKYVAKLEELDVTQVAPTAHVVVAELPLRDDVEEPSLPVELALREAPQTEGGGVRVPSFVEES